MALVFENELRDMTDRAKHVLLSDELPFTNQGNILFEEVPYYGNRTDLVTCRVHTWDAARRVSMIGELTPMPDERKYRHSYYKLQLIEPVTREYWIREDSTYHTEQTCREVWDWFVKHGYLAPLSPQEVGQQATLNGDITQDSLYEDVPGVTVKYPDCLSINAWELKQRDWETALLQAVRADCYADYRWVVMDAGGISVDSDLKKRFFDSGVGLMVLDRDEFNIVVYPDRVTPAKTQTRRMLNERALERISDENRREILEKASEIE